MVVVSPPGEVKMSEVLLEFLEPYDNLWKTEEQLHKLLTIAMVAWNAALVSGRRRDELLQGTLAALPPEARGDGRMLIEEMIRRKEAQFANIKRMVLDHQLTMTPSGPHLSVISTLDSL
jgi:hypothetical protein